MRIHVEANSPLRLARTNVKRVHNTLTHVLAMVFANDTDELFNGALKVDGLTGPDSLIEGAAMESAEIECWPSEEATVELKLELSRLPVQGEAVVVAVTVGEGAPVVANEESSDE